MDSDNTTWRGHQNHKFCLDFTPRAIFLFWFDFLWRSSMCGEERCLQSSNKISAHRQIQYGGWALNGKKMAAVAKYGIQELWVSCNATTRSHRHSLSAKRASYSFSFLFFSQFGFLTSAGCKLWLKAKKMETNLFGSLIGGLVWLRLVFEQKKNSPPPSAL